MTFNEILSAKDKDALDAFAARHGVTLDKRRSFENMLADFRAASPAISNPDAEPVMPPRATDPVVTKAMEPAKPPLVAGMEVVILRPYKPMDETVLIDLGRATEGVAAKLRPGEIVELPIEEAKRAIRAGIATFPAQEV